MRVRKTFSFSLAVARARGSNPTSTLRGLARVTLRAPLRLTAIPPHRLEELARGGEMKEGYRR
nr:hypothetical protein Q903MT_gene381 [Picea sitchensis]